eukprot:scaffold116589_cov22-Prasinocladus_malaysianus.AAC.1
MVSPCRAPKRAIRRKDKQSAEASDPASQSEQLEAEPGPILRPGIEEAVETEPQPEAKKYEYVSSDEEEGTEGQRESVLLALSPPHAISMFAHQLS